MKTLLKSVKWFLEKKKNCFENDNSNFERHFLKSRIVLIQRSNFLPLIDSENQIDDLTLFFVD